jgi:cell division protein FtsB
MRDIDRRIRRYRLARYALPDDPVRRRLRWAWLAGALWLVWIGLFSDHSVLRLAGLGHDHARTERDLERTRAEVTRLEAELRDPRRMRERGEKVLREDAGMAAPGEIIYRIDGGRADSLGRH